MPSWWKIETEMDFQQLKAEREARIAARKQRENEEDCEWRKREGGDRAANAELQEMHAHHLRSQSNLLQALERCCLSSSLCSLPEASSLGTVRWRPAYHALHTTPPHRREVSVYPEKIVLPRSLAKASSSCSFSSPAPKPMSISKMEGTIADTFSGKLSSSDLLSALSPSSALGFQTSATPPQCRDELNQVSSGALLIPSEAARAARVMKRQSDELSVAALQSVHDCKLMAITELHALVESRRASVLATVDGLVDAAIHRIQPGLQAER
jgi:hypothetical protein